MESLKRFSFLQLVFLALKLEKSKSYKIFCLFIFLDLDEYS